MSQKAPTDRKIALITGGSQGIGAATTKHLIACKTHFFVIINYNSNSTAAEALVQEVGAENAMAYRANASSVSEIEKMVEEVVGKFGRIDVLVANAGMLVMREMEGTSEEEFDRLMGLNVKGPFFLAKAAAPHMPPSSHIILLSTSQCHASSVTPAYLLYCMSKGAIEQMTRVLAKDLGRKGILVNAIAPGPTATDLFFEGKSEKVLDMIKGLSPLGRIGEPKEVAEAVGFLCESTWVGGQVLRVNGGMV